MDDGSLHPASSFLQHIVSTIKSSAFFEIVILCQFRYVRSWFSDPPPFRELSQAERAGVASGIRMQLGILREVHKVRAFRLVLCANVWGCVGEYPVRILEEAVAEEKAKKGFDKNFPEPLVIYNPQRYQRVFV